MVAPPKKADPNCPGRPHGCYQTFVFALILMSLSLSGSFRQAASNWEIPAQNLLIQKNNQRKSEALQP